MNKNMCLKCIAPPTIDQRCITKELSVCFPLSIGRVEQ